MSRRPERVKLKLPSTADDKAITAAARSDPDAQPLKAAQMRTMVPLRALRGRPPSPNKKQLVSIRYSPDVLAHFRATGTGWQARMDEALREHIARQDRRVTTDA